jgi:HAE1 family hydrophobic/amphiphilic exporter-1
MSLTRLAIARPVTILMLVLTLIILGLQSRSRLPVDLYPSVEFPMLYISTSYAGTGPEEMETLITKPIEDQVSTISGLKKLTSTSSEGLSQVNMEFEIGTNLADVAADVRSKVDALRDSLPQDAKAPIVIKADIGAMPVISLNMSSTRRSSIEVRHLADDVLKDQLSQLPGVASVSVSGGDVREIDVEVDKDRLNAYGIGINQVVSALQAEDLNLPSGTIQEKQRNFAVRVMGEFTTPEQIYNVRIPNAAGSDTLTIRDVATVRDTVAEHDSFTRVNGGASVAITVQKQSDGNTVKVVDGVMKLMENLTGKPFLDASIAQAKRGAFKPTITAIVPSDVTITTSMDQSTFIKQALHDVNTSLFEGALLAVLIVFLFLHSLRGTLIVALAIPTSMIATFLVMGIFGFSSNMMSMLGLSLSVGILVDDSIVVIENIHRHLKMGKPPKEAAIAGRTEIGLAAMTITMVDVVVFVPIAFMGGIVGQFFRQFGIVVAAATLFSLFISFTLTPMLASRWLKAHDEEEEAEARQQEHPGLFRRFTNAWERAYTRVEHTYRGVLAWSLDHHHTVISIGVMTFLASIATTLPKPYLDPVGGKYVIVIIALMAVVAASGAWMMVAMHASGAWVMRVTRRAKVSRLSSMIAAYGGWLSRFPPAPAAKQSFGVFAILTVAILLIPTAFNVEFSPSTDQRQFAITIQEPVGTTLDATDHMAKSVEADLKQIPELKTLSSTVGGTSSSGLLTAGIASTDTAQINVELQDWAKGMRTTDEMIKAVNARYKGLPGVKITAAMAAGGPGGSPVSIEVSGQDMARTTLVANQVYDLVRGTDGTYGADISWREGRPEVQAHIDRDRAAQYGLSVSQIAAALRTSVEGDTTSKYRENGKEYDIRVSLPKEQRNLANQVPSMIIGNTASGRPVYLYEVVDIAPASGPTQITRADRQRAVTVSAQLAAGKAIGNMQQVIDAKIKALDTRGVSIKWTGQSQMMTESFASMISALALSMALVFILMAALFESIIAPFIIWLAVPQAMAGALFALTFTHKSLSIFSMIGIIMLVGLVTKNSILLVDYTNTLRREKGLSRRDALQEAGPTRLRPILMTTMAMICGMMPTAIAFSKGSEMRQPMAIAVIGGLLLSLFLSLLMVPTFYEIVDSIGERFARVKSSVIKNSHV